MLTAAIHKHKEFIYRFRLLNGVNETYYWIKHNRYDQP